jgi:hypothetical protein
MANYTTVLANITTANSVTEPVRVDGYSMVSIYAQTFSTYTETASVSLEIEGSQTSTTSTFKAVKHMGVYSAGSGLLNWAVPAGVGAYVVTCDPAPYFRYIRLKLNANTATASANISVYMSRV